MTYLMEDNRIVNPAKAKWSSKGAKRSISPLTSVDVHTESSQITEDLHLSRKGNYYIVRTDYTASVPKAAACWITEPEAIVWLQRNGESLPKDLKQLEESLSE